MFNGRGECRRCKKSVASYVHALPPHVSELAARSESCCHAYHEKAKRSPNSTKRGHPASYGYRLLGADAVGYSESTNSTRSSTCWGLRLSSSPFGEPCFPSVNSSFTVRKWPSCR